MFRLAAAIGIALLVHADLASASDGVPEINQACAQTGCFPGDAPGFPVTITQQGSYRLTGNLSLPSNTTAIQIDATFVTLDLGGFLVSGPNACTGYPPTGCTTTVGNPGIFSGQFLVVVRNGSVYGMGGQGIQLDGASSEVDSVRVLGCGGSGIRVGANGRVAHSFSGGNFSDGIDLFDGGTAYDNEVRANGSYGLVTLGGFHSSSMTRNRAFDNGIYGMFPTTNVLTSENVASGNTQGQIFGGRSAGDNLCSGLLC
jgi:hypothetical protein